MTWPVLRQDLKIDCLWYFSQVYQITKKENKQYGVLPTKIAESDTGTVDDGMCVFVGFLPTLTSTKANYFLAPK
jgi:hypothetical protein